MVENVKDAMPRLERLRKELDTSISLTYEVTLYRSLSPTESAWNLFDGKRSHYGATMDDAISAAEIHCGLTTGDVPDSVVMP